MTADTYSSDGVGVLLMGTGNDNNTWGANANTSVFQILADAIANVLTSAVTGGTLLLDATPPPAASSGARYAGLIFTGVLGSNQLVQVPNLNKWWLVKNATSGSFTLKFKTSGGSASTAIPQNSGWQLVRCDGSNVIEVWPFNTVQVQMPDGSVSAPAYSNLTEPTSGWYRAGTQDWRLSINGVAVLQCTGTGAGSPSIVNVLSPNALQVAGAAIYADGSTFKAASGTVAAPGFAFNSETGSGLYRIGAGNVGFSILGVKIGDWSATAYTLAQKLAITNVTVAMSMTGGTTAQRNGGPTAGDVRYSTTFNGIEYWNGTVWIVLGQAPTVQAFTTGTAATYTPTPGTVRIRVRMAGGGGGGGAQTINAGANGGTTTFGSWTALGGTGGSINTGTAGGAGGTGGATGTGTVILRRDGMDGGGGMNTTGAKGGDGGATPFGGAGTGVRSGAGGNAKANTGSGGAGGGGTSVATGTGGGAGEYVEFWVNNPAPTTYTVGTAGGGGGAGTLAGGNGAVGPIIIEEFYS